MNAEQATLPSDWKPLREAAEGHAEALYEAIPGSEASLRREWVKWDHVHKVLQERWISAHMRLLADLTRPASRDFWSRWLAERVGLDVSGGVMWERATPGEWAITSSVPCLKGSERRFTRGEASESQPGAYYCTPGISALTDPAEALRFALLAVGGGE